ncbi:MAG: YlmH/Sll1252 family protein [Hespellia sp.]|nr:YlmH/Sll1252 family protein [Hespellia sp.]
MQKEEQLLQNRLIELSQITFHRDIVTYSDFLNLNELNILHTLPKNQLFSQYETFGGYAYAERQMVAFLPDALYCEIKYPVSILKISPLNPRYSEELTHRDYLGAILNLGIERNKLGDIQVMENEAFIFLQDTLCDFVGKELTRIRHTSIKVTRQDKGDFDYQPKYEERKGTVASVRLDSLLSLAFGASRSKLVGLIEAGKVYVNGRIITTNSYQLKADDVISVRGLGKFQYIGEQSVTKKNRIYVTIHKYI